ncbi:MAG TPA: PfkB family carbohydrate kinase [Anaerolineae bacterium]|nr:PfkB family carbohydrate kinase [Anaerolineae bacterium]
MGQPDFLVIGHVAKDLVGDGYRLGGTAAYSALTARNLGRSVGVVTSAGADLQLGDLWSGIDLICLPSPVTTTFANVYGAEQRQQHIKAVAERICQDSIPSKWIRTPVVHLGPIAGEFGEEMIGLFPSSLVGLTPQGWLRRWDERGRVSPKEWSRASEFLPGVQALIVSEEDLRGPAGTLRTLLGLPRMAVVTGGRDGATLHYQGETIHCAPRQTQALDPTGAGDVFAAAFLVRLDETDDPYQAARFANVAASLSVERAGIESAPQRSHIESHLKDTP